MSKTKQQLAKEVRSLQSKNASLLRKLAKTEKCVLAMRETSWRVDEAREDLDAEATRAVLELINLRAEIAELRKIVQYQTARL